MIVKKGYMEIHYVDGDATNPIIEPGKKAIISHVCNTHGRWGAGFVVALSKRNKNPERQYREWARESGRLKLGEVQYAGYTEGAIVANMVAQYDVKTINGVSPIRYDALKKCLEKVYAYAQEHDRTVHMPRIGCALAGGKWSLVEPIIKETMTVDTWVYTYGPYNK